MGLIKATKGEARIFNSAAGTVASKDKIGYLSEIAYYYNFMEAENLLHFYGSLKGIPREERKKSIKENLEIVGLSDRGKARLKEYSKGMLQRFGI
ncbi:MAG: ABC transporter ATP-binding protein, partial [Geobacter sp.]